MSDCLTNEERDRRVLELMEQVLEIEQRMIPTGLHVFGRAAGEREITGLLAMVASFERPESGIRALTDLIAEAQGMPPYAVLLKESAVSEQRLNEREQVEWLMRETIARFVNASGDSGIAAASEFLSERAGVAIAESQKIFALLSTITEQLKVSGELDGLMQALRGRYVEPGPGADIIQNPNVLPTGRNTHAINPYSVPSAAALRRAEPASNALLDRHAAEAGRYPETIAMVLWGIDNIKTEGEAVAQALWLLGVTPRRDSLNRVTDVDVIPLDELSRPRIDVVMTVSGIFRDLFGTTMGLLDLAVRRIAALDEPAESNYVKKHVEEQIAQTGCSFDEAVVRVFSN
ncbi:MAG TPA: cobaltochelatase subunit CobN, partial [Blastocatellia bacterium]